MQFVGGFDSFRALLEDARAYDDVILAMRGEAQAARLLSLEAGRA